VSTVLFNQDTQVVHDRAPLDKVSPMTGRDYRVGGCTALVDALGDAIRHIGNIHKYARPEDVPEHTVFVITTDGMENASTRYTGSEIKARIKRQTEQYGWEFLFLGANIDAADAAESIGIRRERAANYRQTARGFAACYNAVNEFVSIQRSGGAAPEDEGWKKALEGEPEDNE
jgi:hypothetical protein